MGFPNNIHNKANIPPDILQLLPNAFPYLFARAFLALGQFQIVFAGSSAPHPGLFQLVGFTVSINDVLQLFLCFIQKLEILRVGNVSQQVASMMSRHSDRCNRPDLPWRRKLPAEQQLLPAGSASGIQP